MKRTLTFEQACARFVHRFTMEHIPQWARTKRPDGTYYAPQFSSDREWYENTHFHGEPGFCGSSSDKYCYTANQTWPLGQSLDQPYQKSYSGPGWNYTPYPQPEPFKPANQ